MVLLNFVFYTLCSISYREVNMKSRWRIRYFDKFIAQFRGLLCIDDILKGKICVSLPR